MNEITNAYTLHTSRLILRPFVLDDAHDVARHCNHPDVAKSTLSLPYPYPLESALSWISLHEGWFRDQIRFEYAITLKDSGILVGAVGLGNNKVWKNGEIGYWVGVEHWNQGYATEAVKAVILWAFHEMGYHRVYARHFVSNPASGKVMIKSGMTYEGTQKDHILKNGVYEDVALYGIISE